jgi:hypothetical protein
MPIRKKELAIFSVVKYMATNMKATVAKLQQCSGIVISLLKVFSKLLIVLSSTKKIKTINYKRKKIKILIVF